MENVFAALTAKIAESGKGRCLTVPPHTTHRAGPQWAVRGNHRAVARSKSRSTMYTTDTLRPDRGDFLP
jgi:hypothetical protein